MGRKNEQQRTPDKLQAKELVDAFQQLIGGPQETAVTTLEVKGMDKLKEAVKNTEKLDKAVTQLSKKLLRLPNNLNIDIMYDDSKIDKKIIDRITDIKKNIDYNVGKVFDFPDSKKTIKSLRSSSGALHPLSESSSAALTSVMDSFRQSGGTNVVEMQKIISDMLQIEEHINRLGKKITKKPNDLYDINAVVSYADALKDMIRATKVWIDLQEQAKKANHGDVSFANFNPNIQGMYEDFQKKFESFQEEVIRDWYGQFIKLNGKFDAKVINGIAKAANGKGKLKGIYSKNSAAIEETRSKNRTSDVAVYNGAVAKMYALGVDEALRKITDIVKSKAFKKESVSKDLMKEFSGYLTAYLSGGGDTSVVNDLLKKNKIAGDIKYFLSKEGGGFGEEITKEIEKIVLANKSAAEKLKDLETKTREAGFSEFELKMLANISSKYKKELKDEAKHVEVLTEAYEVLMKVRGGSEQDIRDLFSSKSKVATDIFKMLAKVNKLPIRSNDEKKAALDYLITSRTSLPSRNSSGSSSGEQSAKNAIPLSQDLAESKKYVEALALAIKNIGSAIDEIYTRGNSEYNRSTAKNEISEWLSKYPELVKINQALKQIGRSSKYIDDITTPFAHTEARNYIESDEWNNFLSTLPKAQRYLESIGYEFKNINEQSDNSKPDVVENPIVQKAKDNIQEVENYIDRLKKHIADEPNVLLDSIVLGKDGGLKTRAEFQSELDELIKKTKNRLSSAFEKNNYEALSDKQYSDIFKDVFRYMAVGDKLGLSSSYEIFENDDYFAHYKKNYHSFRDNENKRSWAYKLDALSYDDYSGYVHLRDEQEKLAVMQKNDGQDYIALLTEEKDLLQQISDIKARNEGAGNVDVHTLDMNVEEAKQRAEALEKESKLINRLIERYRALISNEDARFLDVDAGGSWKVKDLEELQSRIDNDALAYKQFKETQAWDQQKIFEDATDRMFSKKANIPAKLETYWTKLEDAILEGSMAGQEAIEKFNAKAQELGVTFDDAQGKWIELSSQVEKQPDFSNISSQLEQVRNKINAVLKDDVTPIISNAIPKDGSAEYYLYRINAIEKLKKVLAELRNESDNIAFPKDHETFAQKFTENQTIIGNIDNMLDQYISYIREIYNSIDFEAQKAQREFENKQSERQARIIGLITSNDDWKKYGEESWLTEYIDKAKQSTEEVDTVYKEFQDRLEQRKREILAAQDRENRISGERDAFQSYLKGISTGGAEEYGQNLIKYEAVLRRISEGASTAAEEIEKIKISNKANEVLEEQQSIMSERTADSPIIEQQEQILRNAVEIKAAYDRMNQKSNEWGRANIQRTLNGEYHGYSETESTRTVLSQLKNAHEAYDLSMSNGWNWEDQYQWAVKFVTLYEQYQGRDNGTEKSLLKHAELYQRLSPLVEGYRKELQKVLDFSQKPIPQLSEVANGNISTKHEETRTQDNTMRSIGRDDKIDFSALRDTLEKVIKNVSASPDVVIETAKVKTEIETAINGATGKPVIQIEPVEIKAEIEKGIGLVDRKANIVATVSDIVYDKKFLPELNAETDGQLSVNPKEIDANKSPLIIDNIGINKAKLGAQIEDAISSSSGTPDVKIDKAKISNDIGSAIDNTTINPSVLTENITEQLKETSAGVNVRPLVDGPEFIHEVESALKDFSVKIASDIEFDLVEKQKKPKASEEAITMAKSIAKELGVANRSVISEAALEIDDLLSGVKSNVSGLFDILAKDGKAGDAVVGVLTNQYSQIMNYIKSSKIKKDPTFSPEFGDDWQNVRKTIGPGVIGRNGVNIDTFIDDLNEVFKVNVEHGINPADSLRNLFDFINKFSVNISDTIKSQWTANGRGVKWLNSAVFGPSERKYTLAQNQPKLKPITSSTTQTQPNNSNQNPPPVSVPVNPVPVNPSAPSTPITPNNPVSVNVPINPNPAPPRKQDDVISQKGYTDEDYWSKTLKLGEARTQTISTSLDEDGNQVEQALPVRIEYSKLEKLLKISAKRRFELASQIDAAVEAKNKELEDLLVEKLIRQTDLDNRLKSELNEYLNDSSYAIEAKPIKGRLNDYEQELLLDGNIKTARTRISGNDKLNSYLRTVDKNYKSIASNRTLPLDASQLSKFEAQRDAVYNLIEQIRADMKNKSRALDSSDIDIIQRSIADMNQLGEDLQEAIRLSRKNSTAKDKVERQINGFLIEIAEADAKYLDNVTKPIKEADKQSMAKKRADVESYIKSYIGRENLSPQDILDIVTRKNAYKHEAENVQRNNYSASKLAAESTDVNVSQLKTKVSSLLLDLKESEAETDRLELKLIDLFERISDSQKSGINTPLYKDFDKEFKLIYDEAKRVQDIYEENNKAYVDNYNTIKQLFDARSELNILEAKQAKRKPGEDYSGLIAKQKEEIKGLETAANEAYDRIVQMSKLAGPDLNTITAKQFDRATKLFEDSKTGSFESQNSKTNAEGSRKYKEQSEAVKELESAVKNYIDTFDILVNVTKNGVDQVDWLKSFESLNDAALKMGEAMSKLRNIGYDNDSIRKIRDDIFADTNFDPKSDVGYVIDYYAKKIDDFEKKLGEVGQGASKSLHKLHNELSEIFHSFNDGYGDIDSFQALNVLNVFGSGLNDIFDDIKNVNSKELKYSKLSKSINEMLNELENSGNEVKKLPEYADKIQEFYKSINDAFKSREKYDDDGNLLPFTQDEYDDLISDLEHIENRIKKFKKDVSGYDYENKKGKIVDDTIGNVSNIDDLTASLKRYAAANKYGDATNVKTAASGDKVTMTFKSQDGIITTLTGTWDKLTNSMRVTQSVQEKMGGGPGFFTEQLSEIGRYVTMTMDVGDVIMWVRGQFSKAIETFKAYDASLTNVSYTMDLTREGLYDLGSDALDMAEDLALSVENAMGIYEIYANMNTTAQEIKDVATPTAILANISGNDTDTTSDQIQGVLQQFNMLEDEANNVADASMHVVDVLADISANVSIDNVKAIGIMSDAVQAAGAEAYQAGLSFEQLAAISAKVSERTRDDGSSIGNALKTIIVRLSKVGKMPGYADEVSNEELSNASKSLNEIGIQVYESNGEFRQLDVILGELSAKWDTLTDAQQANISYNVAA